MRKTSTSTISFPRRDCESDCPEGTRHHHWRRRDQGQGDASPERHFARRGPARAEGVVHLRFWQHGQRLAEDVRPGEGASLSQQHRTGQLQRQQRWRDGSGGEEAEPADGRGRPKTEASWGISESHPPPSPLSLIPHEDKRKRLSSG